MTYVYLVCLCVCVCFFCPFCILLISNSVKSQSIENARKTNVKFQRSSLMVLKGITVRSLFLCVFGCSLVWLQKMLQLVQMKKFSTS
jgi:hypothetical protein